MGENTPPSTVSVLFSHIPKADGALVQDMLKEWVDEAGIESVKITIRRTSTNLRTTSNSKVFIEYDAWKRYRKNPEFEFVVLQDPID